MAARRGGPRRRPGATITTTAIFAAALLLLPLAALGFMLPLRQRLREPNDVHHSFREAAPAMRGQGPNLLTVGPLSAAPPAGDGGGFALEMPPGLAELQQQEEEEMCPSPYTSTTFEEDLFSLDKNMDLSTLLEPLKKEELAFNDAFPPSFVPLTDLFDQGLAATKEAVEKFNAEEAAAAATAAAAAAAQVPKVVASVLVRQGKAAGAALGRGVKKVGGVVKEYVSENTQLLQKVILHLLAEARGGVRRMQIKATVHLEGLLSQLESSLLSPAKEKYGNFKEKFSKTYTHLQVVSMERRAVIQSLFSARLTGVKTRWAALKEKAEKYYLLLKAAADQKLEQFHLFLHSRTTTTTQDGKVELNEYGRAMSKAQGAIRRSLLKGRQLASRVKARQVERWVLGGEGGREGGVRVRGVKKDVSDLVSDFGMRIMKAEEALAIPSSLPSSSSSSSLMPVPAFSIIYGVSGGGREGGRGGVEESVSSVPSFDDEPWRRDEEEEVKEGGREGGREVVEEGGMVGDEVEMASTGGETMMMEEELVKEEGREEEAAFQVSSSNNKVNDEKDEQVGFATTTSSSSSSNNFNVEDAKEDEDEDDDDHHDGLGLTPPTHALIESEEEYLQEEPLPSSSSSLLPSLLLTDTEMSQVEKLKERLVMLPDSLTYWLTPGDLLRFVRTHDHVEKAWQALKNTCYFRRDQGMDLLLSSEKKAKFEKSGMSKEAFWFGVDKEGDPVLVFRTALHQPGRFTSGEYLEYILYLIEKGRVEYGLGQTTQISFLVDRKGGGLKNQDPMVVLALVPLLQTHFPDLLKRTWIAPVNAIFTFIWKILTLVLAKETTRRVQLLTKGEVEGQGEREKGVLREVFHEEQLMTYLGGTLEGYEEGEEGGREGGKGRGNGSMTSVLSSA